MFPGIPCQHKPASELKPAHTSSGPFCVLSLREHTTKTTMTTHGNPQVRVLESERAFERLQLTQTNMLNAMVFGTFLNAALITSSVVPAGAALTLPARVSWGLAGLFGLRIPLGLFKVKHKYCRARSFLFPAAFFLLLSFSPRMNRYGRLDLQFEPFRSFCL